MRLHPAPRSLLCRRLPMALSIACKILLSNQKQGDARSRTRNKRERSVVDAEAQSLLQSVSYDERFHER